MRKRSIRFEVCFNEDEYEKLNKLSAMTYLSKAQVIRFLILGHQPSEAPPVEYKKLITQMRMLGNNINQLIVIARTNGILNTEQLEKHLTALDEIEDEMRDAFNFKKR